MINDQEIISPSDLAANILNYLIAFLGNPHELDLDPIGGYALYYYCDFPSHSIHVCNSGKIHKAIYPSMIEKPVLTFYQNLEEFLKQNKELAIK